MPETIPPYVCECGYTSDTAASALADDDSRPTPGALAMCFGCGDFTIFNSDLTQRPMTPEEFIDLPLEERRDLLIMREVWAETKELRQEREG